MPHAQVLSFQECLEVVEDPRVTGRCSHPLSTILFLVVTAVIAGAEGPSEIEDFGREKQDWLARFVDLPAGVPSHDTIGRVLAAIHPGEFQQALLDWLTQLRRPTDGAGPILVSMDGKTARGSYTDAGKTDALHLVSAWASEHGLTLGQVAVDAKSNEITAIPALLEMLDLRDVLITLDAMGCQKTIARQIIEGGGDYTLAVKSNQPKLYEAIERAFLEAHEAGLIQSGFRAAVHQAKGHGRLVERHYAVGPIPAPLKELLSRWPGAKSIGQAITFTTQGQTHTDEVRYYLSSRPPKVSEFQRSVRQHWGIESMHWVLDVVFGEDASRIRTGYAIENLSFVRRFVTSLLKQDSSRSSLKAKRKRAGWNTTFLEKLLFG
jgi:predicted transposase YbfD/YdcC